MEITTKPFFFFLTFFLSFFLHTWLYLLMTPALTMLVIPGLSSYNGVEVYYLKGVIGLPIVISFRDKWYIYIYFFFFFWKWTHWWCHHHRLDRFRFQNFQSPGADPDQLASSEAIWSGFLLFAKIGHVVFSKRRVNIKSVGPYSVCDLPSNFAQPIFRSFSPSCSKSLIDSLFSNMFDIDMHFPFNPSCPTDRHRYYCK